MTDMMSGISSLSDSSDISGGDMSGFNLNDVSSTLGSALSSTENQMESFLNNMNPNDMDDILQLQMYMIEWETTVQTESSVYKGIGDCLKTVANNVGS